MQPPLTVWVPAHQLRVGDYVHGEGEVVSIRVTRANGWVFVTYKDRDLYSIFGKSQTVEVHLEDDGR